MFACIIYKCQHPPPHKLMPPPTCRQWIRHNPCKVALHLHWIQQEKETKCCVEMISNTEHQVITFVCKFTFPQRSTCGLPISLFHLRLFKCYHHCYDMICVKLTISGINCFTGYAPPAYALYSNNLVGFRMASRGLPLYFTCSCWTALRAKRKLCVEVLSTGRLSLLSPRLPDCLPMAHLGNTVLMGPG